MPYVPKNIRKQLTRRGPETSGELAYVLMAARNGLYRREILLTYYNRRPCFQTHSDILGALITVFYETGNEDYFRAMKSWYADHTREYEREKKRLNGDVP